MLFERKCLNTLLQETAQSDRDNDQRSKANNLSLILSISSQLKLTHGRKKIKYFSTLHSILKIFLRSYLLSDLSLSLSQTEQAQ